MEKHFSSNQNFSKTVALRETNLAVLYSKIPPKDSLVLFTATPGWYQETYYFNFLKVLVWVPINGDFLFSELPWARIYSRSWKSIYDINNLI